MTAAPGPLLYRLDERKAQRWLVLDRDGTITRDQGYTHRPEDLEILPGVVPALRGLVEAGWGLAIATNQGGIARGLFTVTDMEAFHTALVTRLAAEQVPISGVAACPHHPAGSLIQWATPCECRKPRPGMIRALAQQHRFEAGEGAFVGNSETDQQAAIQAGVPFLWGRDQNDWVRVFSDLVEAP